MLIYLFAYLFTNVGAFAVVIAIENATGKVEVKDYAGLVRRAPWLAGLLTIFLLSLAGIPPTGGFMGKFFVFGAAVQSQMWLLLADRGRQQRGRGVLLPEHRPLHVLHPRRG